MNRAFVLLFLALLVGVCQGQWPNGNDNVQVNPEFVPILFD